MASLRAFSLRLLASILGIWSAPPLFAQAKSEWDGWRGISHIKGVATAEYTSHDDDKDEGTSRANSFASYHFEFIPRELQELPAIQARIVPGMPSANDIARMQRAASLILQWEAMEAPRVSDEYHYFNSGTRATPGTTTIDFEYNGKVQRSDVNSGAQFSINLRNGTWNFHALESEYETPAEMTVVQTGEDGRTWTKKRIRAEAVAIIADQPLPKQPQTLTASSQIIDGPTETHPNFGGSRSYHVRLWPEFEDVKLDVIVADYEKWRPLGNIANPKKPGNTLKIVAELKPRNKDAVTTARPKSITFELKDTSHEPGVCLNWPLGAKDKDPDLKLAEDTMYSGKPDDNGQKLIVKDPKTDDRGFYIGQSQIESYDFGSRAEVYVTAQMEDGRTIVGTFKTATGDDDLVNLPKGRKDGDWVAMSWRKDHDVADVPDDDDSENDPKGDGNKGDGYTLYEEYRGWVENGKHIEGDPKKKDFMVLNQRGADAVRGIALFGRLSGFIVHSKFRDNLEMAYAHIDTSEPRRPMNANHDIGPHVVDQFGVVIYGGNGFPGALTSGTKQADADHAFRPHLVQAIFLEPFSPGQLDLQLSTANGVSLGLSQRDAEQAFDRAVAHELLHTVGVDHHGDRGNRKMSLYFQGPTAFFNPTGKARYTENGPQSMWTSLNDNPSKTTEDWAKERGKTITLKWEDTLKDVFEDQLPYYEQKLEEERRIYQQDLSGTPNDPTVYARRFGTTPAFMREYLAEIMAAGALTKVIFVGAKNGLESGNELCVMRYYFATAYKADGKENEYYLIRPGIVHAGREICHSPAGTEGNASSHQPQSRFGDAFADRGDCAEQICPNDAVPPRKVTPQK